MLIGIVSMLLPLPHNTGTIVGLMIIGLGCAPIYPCVIHSTPAYFGEDKSQAIVGMQMACAYVGSMCMPAGIRLDRTACQRAVVPSVHVGFPGADGDHAREPAVKSAVVRPSADRALPSLRLRCHEQHCRFCIYG